MTSRNMSWKAGKTTDNRQPLLLRPAGKDYLWGGNRLQKEYHKELSLSPLAETWECSTHPDGVSIVASGIYKGQSLAEVLKKHPDWLGSHPKSEKGLPVLIKFIDAAGDLSVQVHPDDAYARKWEGQAGKTEMWYVLDAEEDASLIFGFAQDMTKEKILQSLENGRFMEYLQKIPVRRNDVFFIEPGTIHAIGKGIVVAEIQECSNVTYRVYDYGRTDKNGNPRPLHIRQALEVLKLQKEPPVRQQLRVMRYQPGSASESLCRCQYFQVERVLVSSCFCCRVEATSFQVLLMLEGSVSIRRSTAPVFEGEEEKEKRSTAPAMKEEEEKEKSSTSPVLDGEEAENSAVLQVRKGDCVLLPAGCGELEITGKGQLLRVFA